MTKIVLLHVCLVFVKTFSVITLLQVLVGFSSTNNTKALNEISFCWLENTSEQC